MFVTNWISTTKIQKISEITNFFRHYFLSRTEVILSNKQKLNRIILYFLQIIVTLHEINYTHISSYVTT